MNTQTTLICPQCQQQFDFIPTNNRRKYCSYKCKRKANQLPENAESRKRYLNSPKGKATVQRKASKYYQSKTYKARTQSPEYRKRISEYQKQRWRTIRQRKQQFCAICEDPIPSRRKKFCSDLCTDFNNRMQYPAKRNILRRCPGCKQPKQFSGTYCSKDCYSQSDQARFIRRQSRHRRRARMHNAQIEQVDPLMIAKRDKYKCHICRKRVNMDLDVQDIYSPTMDHLIPISLGGDHTYANIRLAHRICNSRKGNRAVNEQLLLFG
ncbi:HNH endonuclease [bacterium]|nr:HNH endonuclease [bacterium]